MEYFPGIFLIVSSLLRLGRRFATLLQARKSTDPPRGGLRVFVVSSLGNLGAFLLGASILLDKLNHPWKSLELGLYGSVLLLAALIRTIANSSIDYLRARFPPRRKNMGVGTVVGWIAATSIGSFLGSFAAFALFIAASKWLLGPVRLWSVWIRVIMGGAEGAAVGLIVGVFQGRVLSQYLAESRRWIWTTIAGLALAYAIGEPFLTTDLASRGSTMRIDIALISRVVRGVSLGLFQWRLLQRWSLRAGWWPVFSTLAAVAGYVTVEFLLPGKGTGSLSYALASLFVSGATVGIVTGVALLWLQKKRVSTGTDNSLATLPSPVERPS